VKALIGLAAAAVLALTAGGINAAIPGGPTGPEPTEGAATRVRVIAVVDGDPVRVETLGGRQLGLVRLLGIDAPEVAHPPEPAECYAEDATRLLEQLAPIGSTVELVTDSSEPNRDSYDRLLRYVDHDHDDVDVARELLVSGAARRYAADQALAREESYTAAVDDAQGAERGLWGTC
jgi:endonuclease YncB( thermonuclease family)